MARDFNCDIAYAMSLMLKHTNTSTRRVSLLCGHSACWLERKLSRSSSFAVMEFSKIMEHVDTQHPSLNMSKHIIRKRMGLSKPQFHTKTPDVSTKAALSALFDGHVIAHLCKKANISNTSVSMLMREVRDMPLANLAALIYAAGTITERGNTIFNDYLFAESDPRFWQ